ncbi:MAG: hypothetical protein NWE89_02690 [Candidatus Bathyarchaeota archaeon]|nr:hypothetical protein [Candidatus Bathyarchaeota archaeon]
MSFTDELYTGLIDKLNSYPIESIQKTLKGREITKHEIPEVFTMLKMMKNIEQDLSRLRQDIEMKIFKIRLEDHIQDQI